MGLVVRWRKDEVARARTIRSFVMGQTRLGLGGGCDNAEVEHARGGLKWEAQREVVLGLGLGGGFMVVG
ncbi:unnamed protein product [Sphenostylis stenocarpa]|uniref:Uncharacterized protein n=1 Tax=Sphenostylis stenocarpa TaxID=92480 RepID=A0AA86SUG8_9FABA|nr:unnamed protein product [Sphenostylis stenocarpa]